MSKHANSREITLFRTKSFLESAQGGEAAEYMALAQKSVGSYYVGNGSARVASGLDFDEENLLMPLVLSVPETHPDFRKRVEEYFINISTSIPGKNGKTLEIGLKSDNNKPVSKDNLPLNLEHYLRYRHAVKHPEVAINKEEGSSHPMKQYYIFNPYELKARKQLEEDHRDEAMAIYLAIKEETKKDPKRLDTMLTLMKEDPREFADHKEKEERLRVLATTNSTEFKNTYENGDLEERYWITTLVNLDILRIISGKYVDMETRQSVANSEEEMLFWFKDDDNAQSISLYKARAQEKLLQPLQKKVNLTKPLKGRTLKGTAGIS